MKRGKGISFSMKFVNIYIQYIKIQATTSVNRP